MGASVSTTSRMAANSVSRAVIVSPALLFARLELGPLGRRICRVVGGPRHSALEEGAPLPARVGTVSTTSAPRTECGPLTQLTGLGVAEVDLVAKLQPSGCITE